MSELPTALQIDGAKDRDDQKEAIKTKEHDMELDQAIHMDVVKDLPADVIPIQKDYQNVPPQETKIEESKVSVETQNDVKVNATVKKAKTARRKTEGAKKLDGLAGAQGTPIPDDWQQYLDEQKRLNQELIQMLKDMRTTRGEAAPLQDQQIVLPQEKIIEYEDPNRPNDFIEQVRNSKPQAIPITAPRPLQMPSSSNSMSEEERYSKRFKKAFDTQFNLVNKSARDRAEMDPTMGYRMDQSSSIIYF